MNLWTWKDGPWTPENNDQHVDSVNLCSCSYCGAKPGQWCKTKTNYIAQVEHRDRRESWRSRSGGDRVPPSDYSVVPPSKGRVITIEMIVPTNIDSVTKEVIADAVDRLATSEGGYAAVVSDKCIEESMEDAKLILSTRVVEL